METICFAEQGQTGVHDPSGGHAFVFAPNGEPIARIGLRAGPACTHVAISGKSRNHLYITESASGTALTADINALDQGDM